MIRVSPGRVGVIVGRTISGGGSNVEVGTGVGETTVGMGVSVGRTMGCFPQAVNVANMIISSKRFILNSIKFMVLGLR